MGIKGFLKSIFKLEDPKKSNNANANSDYVSFDEHNERVEKQDSIGKSIVSRKQDQTDAETGVKSDKCNERRQGESPADIDAYKYDKTSIFDAFRLAVEMYGIDICDNYTRLNNVLSDLVPELKLEKKLMLLLCKEGFISDLSKVNNISVEQYRIYVNNAIYYLKTSEGIDSSLAQKFCVSFSCYLTNFSYEEMFEVLFPDVTKKAIGEPIRLNELEANDRVNSISTHEEKRRENNPRLERIRDAWEQFEQARQQTPESKEAIEIDKTKYEEALPVGQNEGKNANEGKSNTKEPYSNKFEPVKIKKQEISSNHLVIATEDLTDYKSDIYNLDFGSVIDKSQNICDASNNNDIAISDTKNKFDSYILSVETEKKGLLPSLTMLDMEDFGDDVDNEYFRMCAEWIEDALRSCGVNARCTDYYDGYAFMNFEFIPEPGTRISKFSAALPEVKLVLGNANVAMQIPIPGKNAIGVIVEKPQKKVLHVRSVFRRSEYIENQSKVPLAIGLDISNKLLMLDLEKYRNLLIVGNPAFGKRNLINVCLLSIMYKATVRETQFVFFDMKGGSFECFKDSACFPRLISSRNEVQAQLEWLINEIDARLRRFRTDGVRNISGYNKNNTNAQLSRIIVAFDDASEVLLDSNMREMIDRIIRSADVGIYIIMATSIYATRYVTPDLQSGFQYIACLNVSTSRDSKNIIGEDGAEKLNVGLAYVKAPGVVGKTLVQIPLVSQQEMNAVVKLVKNCPINMGVFYGFAYNGLNGCSQRRNGRFTMPSLSALNQEAAYDDLLAEAGRCVINTGKGSIGFIQRKFQIGFNRAARIMDTLTDLGVVSDESGTKAREILMSIEEFEYMIEDLGL